jgi:hypothetical protein
MKKALFTFILLALSVSAFAQYTTGGKGGGGGSVSSSISTNASQLITTAGATTINNQVRRVLVNPATVLATGTFTLPAIPNDGDQAAFFFGGTIANGAAVVTALSIVPNAGHTIKQTSTPTTAVGGDTIIYEYNSALLAWIRIR